MSAFTIVTLLAAAATPEGANKRAVFTATGPASYDTGGSVLDLSQSGTLGINGLTVVAGVQCLGVAAAASDRYRPTYVRAAAGAAATGLVKLRDADAGTIMAQPAGAADLSGTTFIFEAVGK